MLWCKRPKFKLFTLFGEPTSRTPQSIILPELPFRPPIVAGLGRLVLQPSKSNIHKLKAFFPWLHHRRRHHPTSAASNAVYFLFHRLGSGPSSSSAAASESAEASSSVALKCAVSRHHYGTVGPFFPRSRSVRVASLCHHRHTARFNFSATQEIVYM